jgi:NAD(P)H-hydrate epimerase
MGVTKSSELMNRVAVAREFAVTNSVILVLKGARTLIAAPNGKVVVNPTGNPGLGTAGSGDTLTGIITGFLAQAVATLGEEADPFEATVAAVYVGGLAADFAAGKKGMRNMVASDIRAHLSEAFMALDPRGEQP